MTSATAGQTASQQPLHCSEEERAVLEAVDATLADGRDLLGWWRQTSSGGVFAQRFEQSATFHRPDSSFGFFDQAYVGGRAVPVMGNSQRMFYDRPKSPPSAASESAVWINQQLREFVLRYFMRVSDFRQPEPVLESTSAEPPAVLKPLSWCPEAPAQRRGFGFSQVFSKRRQGGEIRRFDPTEAYAIVDLREIGETYEWIVVKVNIFDFNLTLKPFGVQGPQLVLPATESSYLVLSADFLEDRESPQTGDLGCFGLGYAFLKNPRPGVVGYGPGEFEAAVQTIRFRCREDGRIDTEMMFVSRQPERILNLSLNPVEWGASLADGMSLGMASRFLGPLRSLGRLPGLGGGFDPVLSYVSLANLVSGGYAGRELCISREELLKEFLLLHFKQHYQTVAGSLQTWRQIPDWLDTAALPRWVLEGTSS